MVIYPLLLSSIYKEMIWGSESWDVSCRPDEMCIVENGPAAGMTLESYINQDKEKILGTRLAHMDRFPLLVKIIDAKDRLSVQVHPNDCYFSGFTQKNNPGSWHPADTGKSEMWYILVPPTDGRLIIGLKPDITPELLRQAYENGTVEDCLNHLHVKVGDIINIPPGLIHALTPGVKVAEVQQNSDITFRLYDYNRVGLDGKPRQLHVDDTIAVTDFSNTIPKSAVPGLRIKKGNCNMVYAIANEYFAVIKYELTGEQEEISDPAAFCIFTCVEGDAEVASCGLSAGRSIFIPAGLGRYTIRPSNESCILLKSFVPDIQKDFISPLRCYGYTETEIASHT
ncbi:MAG: class I mannose-6-phosphate isomerase [Defluviitaleaceae bacterium]|nr:class I mannose-6-phosphate isomerase [Defluviitaleaceae bacterium]